MAAVFGSPGEARVRYVVRPDRVSLRLVERDVNGFGDRGRAQDAASCVSQRGSPVPRARWLRRVAGAFVTFLALAGLWVGTGALRSTENAPATGRAVHAVVYVARPGDTLWAIATRLDPSGDPEQIVTALAGELRGVPLRPGVVLTLPAS